MEEVKQNEMVNLVEQNTAPVYNQIMIEELFNAGFQYGHKAIKSSPKMKKYIHEVKWGISIIDLCQTAVMFEHALNVLFDVVKKGGKALFVGTKYQVRPLIEKYATEAGQWFINKRWLGGSLTNYDHTIITKNKRLESIEMLEESGVLLKYAKKEQLKILKEKETLLSEIKGVRTMQSLPDLLIVVDARKEHIALSEAKSMKIPTVVLADTDTQDPAISSTVVPGNDDGFTAVDFFLSKCSKVILEASLHVDKAPKGPKIVSSIKGENS